MKIAIVDYGAGNLPSVERALRKLGAETERATDPSKLLQRKRLCCRASGISRRLSTGLRERNLTSSLA